jgi:hypothetical protein
MRHGAMGAIAMTEWRPFWDGMPDDRRKAGIVERLGCGPSSQDRPRNDPAVTFDGRSKGPLAGDLHHLDDVDAL